MKNDNKSIFANDLYPTPTEVIQEILADEIIKNKVIFETYSNGYVLKYLLSG